MGLQELRAQNSREILHAKIIMEYTCFNCRKKIEFEKRLRRIRCPWCGGKILMKTKPHIVKKIKAI